MARLSRLIKAVEDTVHAANPSKPRPTYHLWIDTLCCPVAKLEPHCNAISLTRMKTVYEQATHVLVLDLALSVHDAEPLHPVTLLLLLSSLRRQHKQPDRQLPQRVHGRD